MAEPHPFPEGVPHRRYRAPQPPAGVRAPIDRVAPGRRRVLDPRAVSNLPVGQAYRRRRALEACLDIASESGYENVHVRTVAARARLAIGTLYRYFTSTDHMLVCGFGLWLNLFRDSIADDLVPISDPYSRLAYAITAMNQRMSTTPLLSHALTRAYLGTEGAELISAAETTRQQMISTFAAAMAGGQADALHHQIGTLLADQWASAALAFAHGRISAADLGNRLLATVGALEHRHEINSAGGLA